MRDVGAAHHAAEDRAQPRSGEHLLGEDGEGVMHIVFWYSSGDAVQVSRSHAQEALSPDRIGCRVCSLRKLDHERRRSGDSLLEGTGSVLSIQRLLYKTRPLFIWSHFAGRE